MKLIYRIAKSELATLFYSPIAWLILVLFTFQAYSGFVDILGWEVQFKEMSSMLRGNKTIDIFVRGGWAPYLTLKSSLYLYLPLITMGLMSREYSSGSIKLLFSSPVSNFQIIFGKYLSMMFFGLILMAVLAVMVVVGAFSIKNLNILQAMSGMLGLYLLWCTYSAIGLYISTLTSYQIVAALGTLTLIGMLNFVGTLWQDIPVIREMMRWFSLEGKADQALWGLICSEDILYFIMVSFLFLGLAVLKLRFQRNIYALPVKIGYYALLITCVFTIGYLSAQPMMKYYYDTTEHKQHTITPLSQQILKQIEGNLTLNNYVNILDGDQGFRGLPGNWYNDRRPFDAFIRFKPEIEMNYFYYYDNYGASRYSPEEMEKQVRQTCIYYDFSRKMVKTPEEMKTIRDLSAEEHRLVRYFDWEKGKSAVLRMYHDQNCYPSEAEITAALKTMIVKSPVVAFLSGHGERDIYRGGDRNYSTYVTTLTSREAILNQGYTPRSLVLQAAGDVPDDVDILVIADPRESFTPDELQQIRRYIDRGGNLVVAAEAYRQQLLDSVVGMLGLRYAPGVLVQPTDVWPTELVFAGFTAESGRLNPRFTRMVELGGRVSMPTAVGISLYEDKGFQVLPLLITDNSGCWNEVTSSYFADRPPVLNREMGETEMEWPLALALTRSIGGKEQRIVVLGDADCMSNYEMAVDRSVRSGNYTLFSGIYRWLVYDEFPIDVSRPEPTDNDVYLKPAAFVWVKVSMKWIIPALFAVLGIAVWLIRRRK